MSNRALSIWNNQHGTENVYQFAHTSSTVSIDIRHVAQYIKVRNFQKWNRTFKGGFEESKAKIEKELFASQDVIDSAVDEILAEHLHYLKVCATGVMVTEDSEEQQIKVAQL